MAKFKPAGRKRPSAPPARGGLPCIILLVSAMVLAILLMILFLKYASG